MRNTILLFGLLVFSVLMLFQLARFTRFQSVWSIELWIAIFSLVFLFIGIFLAKKLQKETIIEKQVFVYKSDFQLDIEKKKELKISDREYQVLLLIDKGMSNQQIAETLYVSENTIKKHITNLFMKLQVERRTEAIRKAKELNLVE